MIRTIDYSALGSPVTKPDVAAYRAELSRTKPDLGMGSWIGVIILSAMVVSFGAIFLAIIGPAIASAASSAASVGAAILVLVVPFLILAALITGIVLLVRYLSATRYERWVRLDRFATANGLVFSPSDPNPQYPGA